LGQALTHIYRKDSKNVFGKIKKIASLFCHVKNIPLNPGNYYLDLWIADRFEALDYVEHACDLVIREKTRVSSGEIHREQCKGNIFVKHGWKLIEHS